MAKLRLADGTIYENVLVDEVLEYNENEEEIARLYIQIIRTNLNLLSVSKKFKGVNLTSIRLLDDNDEEIQVFTTYTRRVGTVVKSYISKGNFSIRITLE